VNSVKAIGIGCLFIIVVGLSVQLAYLFLAVGYVELAKSWPFLNQISSYFRYIVGIPAFLLIMFAGGFIAADLAKQKVLLHSFLVGVVMTVIMITPLLENMELTISGAVVTVLSLISTVAGGVYQQRQLVGSNV
jgi:hypothetical protein